MADKKTHVPEKSLKQMNSFLRGEASAVETYEKAFEQHPELRSSLEGNLESHHRRVQALSSHIREMGGEPDHGSGAWGSFAKTLQALSGRISRKQAVSQLQDGEKHGTRDYERHYDDLDRICRDFVTNSLMPEQQNSHSTINRVLEQEKRAA